MNVYRRRGKSIMAFRLVTKYPELHAVRVNFGGQDYILKDTEVISEQERLAIIEATRKARLERRLKAYLETLKPIVLAYSAGCRTYASFADKLGKKARQIAPCVRAAVMHGLIPLDLSLATKKARGK